MRKSLNQTGFSAVETLLFIVIIAIIGGTGFYVYHANKKTNDINTSAAKVAQNSPAKGSTKKVATTQSAQKYFTIKEWGVEAPYSGSLSLKYSIVNDNPGQDAAFDSTQLAESDPQCASGTNGGGIITRYALTDKVTTEDGTSGETPAQFVADPNYNSSSNPRVYAHVGNYYYLYTHPQDACGNSQSSYNIQDQTEQAVQSLVKNLQAIPQ